MSRVHMHSFWLGAHGTLMLLGLCTLIVSWWALVAVFSSGLCLWANWSALRTEATSGVKTPDGAQQ